MADIGLTLAAPLLRVLAHRGEVTAHELGQGVVGAENPRAVGQGLLIPRDGPAQVPRRLVGADEVAPREKSPEMVGIEHPQPVGSPSVIDQAAKTVRLAPQLPGWEGLESQGTVKGFRQLCDLPKEKLSFQTSAGA